MSTDLAEQFISCIEGFFPEQTFLLENYPLGSEAFRDIKNREKWLGRVCTSADRWVLASRSRKDRKRRAPVAVGFTAVGFTFMGRERYIASVICGLPVPDLDTLVVRCGDLLRSYSMQDSARRGHASLNALRDPYPEHMRVFVPTGTSRVVRGIEVPEGVYRLARDLAVEEYPWLSRLPRTRAGSPQTLDAWKYVDRIEWLNYWSNEVAERAGLDASLGDRLPFYKFMKTEHGWYFRLTEAPLDIGIREHADLLLAVYDEFPRVGTRVD